MRIAPPPRRAPGESVVPMINVVFLLLVFFLMTATLSPPDPLAITPPTARGGAETDRSGALYLAASGRLAGHGLEGEALLAHLAGFPRPTPPPLLADRETPSRVVAETLRRLAAAGIPQVRLIVESP